MRLAVGLVVFWIVALAAVIPFVGRFLWFPELISEHGATMDRQFALSFVAIGTVFFLSQLIFGYTILRYGDRGRARGTDGRVKPRVEFIVTLIVVGLFFLLDVALSFFSETAWAAMYLGEPTAGALPVEITGEQFAWNIRYPGKDGRFGQTDPRFMSRVDPLGLDPEDSAAQDDIVTSSELRVPVHRTVRLTLRSKDVLHSFWVPSLRVKQDAVPGMAIAIEFKATKAGIYEIACAELCGLGHHRMKGYVVVMPESEFENWLREASG